MSLCPALECLLKVMLTLVNWLFSGLIWAFNHSLQLFLIRFFSAEHVIGVGMGGKGGGMGKDGLSGPCGTRQNGHSRSF